MTKEQLLESVKKEAEGYFDRGEFFCSEAVAHTIKKKTLCRDNRKGCRMGC